MTPTNGEARLDVSMLRFSRDGGLWAVANGRARKARDRTWIWTDEAGRGLTGPFRVSVNFLEDRRGGVWLTHFGKGVLHVRPDGRARRITGADGLPGTRVRNLLEDREGNVWLAIERAGLVRVRDAWFQTLSTDGPREIAVASVAADRDGAMWIGSMGDGLQRYRDGTLASYPVPDASAGGFVFSVVPDADRPHLAERRSRGSLLLRRAPHPAVAGARARRQDAARRSRRRAVGRHQDRRGAHRRRPPPRVRPRGRLRAPRRAGAGAGPGRRRVDRLGRRHDLSLPRWPADALPSAGCAGLARGLGAAHRRRGLAVGRHVPRRPAAAARRPLRALHHRPRPAEQHHLPDPRGPVAAAVDRLAPGHLPRQQGVARWRRGEPARCRHLRPIGRPARARVHRQLSTRRRDQPRRPAVVRDAQGPRVDRSARRRRGPAAARRDPRRAAARPAPRGAGQTRARGGARSQARGEPAAVLQIPPGPHRLEFRYTGLSFATPEQVRFRYRVEGLETDWVEAGAQRAAHYSYLPPGTLPLPRRRQPRRRPLEQRRGGGAVRGPAAPLRDAPVPDRHRPRRALRRRRHRALRQHAPAPPQGRTARAAARGRARPRSHRPRHPRRSRRRADPDHAAQRARAPRIAGRGRRPSRPDLGHRARADADDGRDRLGRQSAARFARRPRHLHLPVRPGVPDAGRHPAAASTCRRTCRRTSSARTSATTCSWR